MTTPDPNSRPPRRQFFLEARRTLRKITGMNLNDDDDVHTDGRAPPDTTAAADLNNPSSSPTTIVPATQTLAELEATTNPQLSSSLFSRLPAELRRMIYVEVWRAHIPLGKMHIHAADDKSARLSHTACRVAPADEEADDNAESDMARYQRHLRDKQPPDWFWWAWCLRLRWGSHGWCQSMVMDRWDPVAGRERPYHCADGGDMRALFLVCKRMYAESISTLFNTTTLQFESSSDASLFLSSHHRFLPSIRFLSLNLVYEKDHLYLWSIAAKHPRLSCCGTTTLVGKEVWEGLVEAMKDRVPELARLDVVVGCRSVLGSEGFSRAFEARGWRPGELNMKFRCEDDGDVPSWVGRVGTPPDADAPDAS